MTVRIWTPRGYANWKIPADSRVEVPWNTVRNHVWKWWISSTGFPWIEGLSILELDIT